MTPVIFYWWEKMEPLEKRDIPGTCSIITDQHDDLESTIDAKTIADRKSCTGNDICNFPIGKNNEIYQNAQCKKIILL